MRTNEGNNIMAITEGSQAADEPRAICVIRDLTDMLGCQSRSITLPASYTVQDLLEHVSKEYNYQLNSFKLLYERDSRTELLDDGSRMLSETVANVGNTKKNRFQITEIDDGVPPVKLKTGGSLQFDELAIGEPASNSPEYTSTDIPYNNRYITPTTTYNNLQLLQDTGFCGLVNQAMTCYLNSLLQTLYMTPEFRNALYCWEYNRSDGSTTEDKCIPYQLQRLFLQMQTGKHRSVETTPVTRSFGWDSSHSWQQHDVQELCRVMFDALEINLKNTQQANLINELYQGKLKDYVKCLECKTESFRTDAYLDIPLVIKPFGATRAYPSVEAALRAFIEPEVLSGSNQYQCDKCNKKCDAHKGLKFESFPYLLTLQLKRFDFDYTTMNRVKLNDRMHFPDYLDLNSLIDDDTMPPTPDVISSDSCCFSAAYDGISVDKPENTNEVDDLYSGQASSQEPPSLDQGEYIYELFSIMIHSGSAVGGHYYAYIKCLSDHEWYSFNDQSVSRITKEDITKTYGGYGGYGGTGSNGGGRGIFSSTSTYTSSTNAYMLMYRKLEPDRNVDFIGADDFPGHIKELIKQMDVQTEAHKQAREIELSTCKIRTYVRHPGENGKLKSETLEAHKDLSLQDTTEHVYKMFQLEGLVPLDCVRLVRYNSDLDSIERSFSSDDTESGSTTTIGQVLGGVKSMYTFELLLEIRRDDQEWQDFQIGGATYKVYALDTETRSVRPAVAVRASTNDTVAHLKTKITKVLALPKSDYMRCVLERRGTSELIPLVHEDKPLREVGFNQGTKVYVDSALQETGDTALPFNDSRMRKIIDTYQHTIRLLLTVPSTSEICRFMEKQQLKLDRHRHSYKDLESDGDIDAGFDEISRREAPNKPLPPAPLAPLNPFVGGTEQISSSLDIVDTVTPVCTQDAVTLVCTRCSDCTLCRCQTSVKLSEEEDDGLPLGASAANAALSLSNRSIELTETKTSPVVKTEESDAAACSVSKVQRMDDSRSDQVWDYDVSPIVKNASSPRAKVETVSQLDEGPSAGAASDDLLYDTGDIATAATEQEEEVFFSEESVEEINSKTIVLAVQIDKRITLKKLKLLLERRLSIPMNNFKIYKVYSNNQEIECGSTTDPLSMMSDNSRMSVKLGRVLLKGEYRVKIYELELNSTRTEAAQSLIELIAAKGMTVAQAKEIISEELLSEFDREVPADRIRLRKKTWRNPGTVYFDSQRIEDDISMYSNWEMFIQVLEDGPEPITEQDDMALFIQQWKPSLYEFGPMTEIVIPSSSQLNDLKSKLSELSGIPTERLEVAKGRGTFPGDVSVLDAHTTGLDWNPAVTYLTSWPIYLDSGSMVIYRDKDEELAPLSADKRKEITLREANSHCRPSATYSRKEKALKIYTHNDDDVGITSSGGHPSPQSHSLTQANDLD